MASADYHSGIPVLPATPPPRQKQRLMVLVGCCMLSARWVAPRGLWNNGGRHGRKMLLAAHFVGVLCLVLHFTWLSKDMNSYHINSNVHMNSYMQNKNSLPLTDHLRDVFLASIFLVYVEPKLFFSLSRGKMCDGRWSEEVRTQFVKFGVLEIVHTVHT